MDQSIQGHQSPIHQVQPTTQRVCVLDDGQLALLRREDQQHRHHPAVETLEVNMQLKFCFKPEFKVDHRGHCPSGDKTTRPTERKSSRGDSSFLRVNNSHVMQVKRVAEAREEVQEARRKHSGARDKLEGKAFAPMFLPNIHLLFVTYLLQYLYLR